MEKEVVDTVVELAKSIVTTNDRNFIRDTTKHLVTRLLALLNGKCKTQPLIGLAVNRYLTDNDFHIGSLKGDAALLFYQTYGRYLRKDDPATRTRIEQARRHLFSPIQIEVGQPQ